MRCEACGTNTDNARFCSRSCSARITNSEVPRRGRVWDVTCAECGSAVAKRKRAGKYCNNNCQLSAQKKKQLTAWLEGTGRASTKDGRVSQWAREYLYKLRGECCEVCGWAEPHPVSGRPPLQIDHVDGDRANDSIENLKIYCPNHHALTETWGYFGRSKTVVSEAEKRGAGL